MIKTHETKGSFIQTLMLSSAVDNLYGTTCIFSHNKESTLH